MSLEELERWLWSQIDHAIKTFDAAVRVRVLNVESRITIHYGDAAKARSLCTKRHTERDEYGTLKSTRITHISSIRQRTILRYKHHRISLPSAQFGKKRNVFLVKRRMRRMRLRRR